METGKQVLLRCTEDLVSLAEEFDRIGTIYPAFSKQVMRIVSKNRRIKRRELKSERAYNLFIKFIYF